MNPEYSKFISDVWHARPTLVVLLVTGLIVFVLCVIDTHFHRKKIKKRHQPKHHH